MTTSAAISGMNSREMPRDVRSALGIGRMGDDWLKR